MTEQIDLNDLERQVLEEEAEALEAFIKGTGEAPVLYRAASGAVSKADSDGPIEFVLSHESDDRMGDIIRQDGWDLSNFKRNPVMLWAHDSRGIPPIGKWTNVRVDKKSLSGVANFDPDDPFAVSIESKVRRGFLNAVSVGFRPLEMEWRENAEGGDFFRPPADFKKNELLETSVVSVPAHPKALRKALEIATDGRPEAKRFIFLPGESFGVFEAREVEMPATRPSPSVTASADGALEVVWDNDSDDIFDVDKTITVGETSISVHVDTSELEGAVNRFTAAVEQVLSKASPVSVDENTEPDSEADPEPELTQETEPADDESTDIELLASELRKLRQAMDGETRDD